MDYLTTHTSVRYAVLSSPFIQYLRPGAGLYADGAVARASPDLAAEHLLSTLAWLTEHGVTPVIVSPPPRDGSDIGACLSRSAWLGGTSADCRIGHADYLHAEAPVIAFLKAVSLRYPVIFLQDYLCTNETCESRLGDAFVYRDAGHLSREGSRRLGEMMKLRDLIVGVNMPAS